jgi:hypothetical protein
MERNGVNRCGHGSMKRACVQASSQVEAVVFAGSDSHHSTVARRSYGDLWTGAAMIAKDLCVYAAIIGAVVTRLLLAFAGVCP